jgi:glucose dehydrogenase
VRDHYRGPIEDERHRCGGYTRAQLAFLASANAAAVFAVDVLIGFPTALIYTLALALGLVLGVPWAYQQAAAAAPARAAETLKRVDQLALAALAALGALLAGRTDDAKARLQAISNTTLTALEEGTPPDA